MGNLLDYEIDLFRVYIRKKHTGLQKVSDYNVSSESLGSSELSE